MTGEQALEIAIRVCKEAGEIEAAMILNIILSQYRTIPPTSNSKN